MNQSNPTDSSNSLMRFQRDLKMVLHSIALLMFCYHTKKSNILHDTTSISLFLSRSQQQDHRNALSHSASREMAFLDETQKRQLPLSSSRSNCQNDSQSSLQDLGSALVVSGYNCQLVTVRSWVRFQLPPGELASPKSVRYKPIQKLISRWGVELVVSG